MCGDAVGANEKARPRIKHNIIKKHHCLPFTTLFRFVKRWQLSHLRHYCLVHSHLSPFSFFLATFIFFYFAFRCVIVVCKYSVFAMNCRNFVFYFCAYSFPVDGDGKYNFDSS